MWSPCLTNDKHPIHEILPRPVRPTFAFLGGARLGGKLAKDGVFQEKVEISVCRAMLVTEGVHRAHSNCREVLPRQAL